MMREKYSHALFLNPYIEKTATSAMSLFPPTGLEYVATSAKDFVGKVTVIDLRCEKELTDPKKLAEFIRSEKIDFVGVTISWNRHFEEILEFLKHIPDGIPLVVGGYKATETVEEIFKLCPRVDMIIRGEGEETIQDVVKGLEPEDILGLSFRKNGQIVHNKNRPLPDVNTVKVPDRTLRRYKYAMLSNGVKVTPATFDTILSSRGCPFSCKFCTFSLNPLGQKRNYASRSVESVIKEIEAISADMILFSDDNFFTEPKRAEKICDEIIKRKIKKRFVAQARIDVAKYPILLDKAAKAGFKMLMLGIESPHDRILVAMNKGFDQKTIRENFKVLTKYPIFYHGNFIYGNIGETEEEMLYISKFAREIGVDTVAFSKLRVDKYSPLREVIANTPGYHLTKKGELYSDKYSHSDLKKIHRKLKFSFFTPGKLLAICKKILVIRYFTLGEAMYFFAVSPRLLAGIVGREIQKGRLADTLKRVFVHHA